MAIKPFALGLLLAAFAQGAVAADAKPQAKKEALAESTAQPDIDFLEYLGTLESDDDNWTDVIAANAAEPQRAPAKTEAAAAKRAEKQ